MISIRYHVFSLIAVFLALAIGLAAGSTVVKESIVDNLRANQDRLESELDELEAANAELELRVGRLEETDRRLRNEGPLVLLDGRLLGMAVVLITGEGLDGEVRADVLQTIADAGAEPAGEIEVLREVGRDERSAELGELVGAAPDDDPVDAAAATLATALLEVEGGTEIAGANGTETIEVPNGPSDGEPPPPATQPEAPEPSAERVALDDLLDAFADAGFANASGPVADTEAPLERTPMFVVVGGRPDDEDVTPNGFLASLVAGLAPDDESDARTVVGDAAVTDPAVERAPLVAAVRDDDDVWDRVTSVDDLEAFAGLAAVTLAVDDLRFGRTGHYGVGNGADALLPSDP
jgi:hypothetical protein